MSRKDLQEVFFLSAALALLVAAPSIVSAAEFTPLTQLPGIQEAASSDTIPEFLNNVYKICIGAAAVLAVLQIMRGGFSYMLGDSITEKKEARSLIVMSVMGLLLVLSPVVVFNLIDPRILSLQVNFSSLSSGLPDPGAGQPTGGNEESVCAQFEENPESIGVVTELVNGRVPAGAFTWQGTDRERNQCISACEAKVRAGPTSTRCAAEPAPNEQGIRMYCDCRPDGVSTTQHRFDSVTVTVESGQYRLLRHGSFFWVANTQEACVAGITPRFVREQATNRNLICDPSIPGAECLTLLQQLSTLGDAQIGVSNAQCAPSAI